MGSVELFHIQRPLAFGHTVYLHAYYCMYRELIFFSEVIVSMETSVHILDVDNNREHFFRQPYRNVSSTYIIVEL